jgi:hypothetical protein
VNRVELEALLYRMQNAYPAAKVGGEGTVDEWSTSTLMGFSVAEVFTAFDEWRDTQMWPPTLADLINDAQKIRSRASLVSKQAALDAANFNDEQGQHADGELVTFRCPNCKDQGFVPRAPADALSGEPDYSDGVYPCPDCKPFQYERWKGGHFKPGHTCAECVMLQTSRGRATVLSQHAAAQDA